MNGDKHLKNHFLESIRNWIRRPDFRPASKSELARAMGVAPKHRAAFREALRQLEASGDLVKGKKARYQPSESPKADGAGGVLTGTISFPSSQKRRHGFFTPDPEGRADELKGVEGDIFVPEQYAGTALHGDRVAVKIGKRPAPRWHRHVKSKRDRLGPDETTLEARVVKVLERKNTRIVGTFRRRGKFAHFSPDDTRLPETFNLSEVIQGAESGDKAIVEFESWDSPRMPPRARMVELLGRPGDPGVDILAVIHRCGLPLKFPGGVLAEAERIPEEIEPAEIERREDWREREVFTIDPGDAKDFDDAICVHHFRREEGGGWELAVHIADVSHYVRAGSALDKEAKKRGNSVYLADRVIPMLPEKLSNGVCSLKPDVERLTHAVIMRFTDDGQMTGARFASAVIRSRRRYSYEEAFARLNLSHGEIRCLDAGEARLAEHLKRAWALASRLRGRRFEAGSLDLDFPEVRAVLDERGVPVGVKRTEHDESHQLIEEFMLAANEAVARKIKNAQAPSIYRVHEDPDPEKLTEFAYQAREYGYSAGDVTVRAELQKVLRAMRGKPEEHSLKIALLKSLKRADYRAEPQGHYGLAKLNYTHFTSPIRRYADLIVHRVLRRLDPDWPQKDSTPSQGTLAEIAGHISQTERVAADAEMETQRLKLIEYLLNLSREEEGRTFPGVVYEVRPIGAFVELTDLMIKGLIRKEDLSPDRYRFDSARQQLVGGYGRVVLGVGRLVQVRVVRVDKVRGFIDFELA